jgi:hypothetical protein
MPDTAAVTSTDDLLEYVEHSLARHYIKLLYRCARGEQTVGALETAIQPPAVTDWEAAAILPGEITVGQITDIRETLCRNSPLIVREDSRKGKPCWKLHDELIDNA